jgi:hypothetical protein
VAPEERDARRTEADRAEVRDATRDERRDAGPKRRAKCRAQEAESHYQ